MTDRDKSPTYITTAIPYVNAAPHVGFALELVQADVLARYHRRRGRDVRFLSGTDDNSLKNVRAAEDAGVPVAELVRRNGDAFEALGRWLQISWDDFIRTGSDARHLPGVHELWRACERSGDLYKATYSGLYCVGCESYVRESDLADGRCPEHRAPPEVVDEENYFFRLSRYRDDLLALIRSGRLEIYPARYRNEALSFIERGLEDFSVSRQRGAEAGWGIPVPGDSTQSIYVWFDALGNYITALDYGGDGQLLRRYWGDGASRTHVIGKGITRFHAIYWPEIRRPGPASAWRPSSTTRSSVCDSWPSTSSPSCPAPAPASSSASAARGETPRPGAGSSPAAGFLLARCCSRSSTADAGCRRPGSYCRDGHARAEETGISVCLRRSRDRRGCASTCRVRRFDALVEAGRVDDAVALCRLVLERGAEFESHWWTRLGRLLVDRGRIDEAEEAIREVVWRLESYAPDMLVVCMDYHRARGDQDKEAAAFFGGKLFYTAFNYSVNKERSAGYGPVPPDGRDRYARWLDDWIGARLEARSVKRLGHWLAWFDKLASPVFAEAKAAIEAERDRRIRLRGEIAAANDASRIDALVTELRRAPADADDMLGCAYQIHQRFPRAAYDLLEHGLRSDGVIGYKGHGVLRAANNLLYQCLQSDELLGRADEALALALPWGRRNPGIFHNAACIAARLGRPADR